MHVCATVDTIAMAKNGALSSSTALIHHAKLVRGLPVCPRRPRGRPLSLLLRNELLGNGLVSLRKREKMISGVSGKHSCEWGLQNRWWKGIKSGSTVGNVKKKEDSIKNMDGEASYKRETRTREWWKGLDARKPFVTCAASSGYWSYSKTGKWEAQTVELHLTWKLQNMIDQIKFT